MSGYGESSIYCGIMEVMYLGLSNDLISQFVKMTNDSTDKKSGKSHMYATAVKYDGSMYVKIDGSDLLTPVDTSSMLHENDRVIVDISNHNALVSGNISNPSVSNVEIVESENKILLIFKEGYHEGITSVDAEGITVSHTGYKGYTKMSYDGFYLNDGENDVLTCTVDGLTYTGTITGSTINGSMILGGSINIGDDFFVDEKGRITTNSEITAKGGLNTYQDIRGLGDDIISGGLTLVSGVGHVAIRTEDPANSVYLQSASGEVKCTKPASGDEFINLRAYNLLANNEIFANGVSVTSDINRKRDIELYNVDALAEICSTPVYAYHLDVDLDAELKRIGIIMQEAPVDAVDLNGKGVDLYQMVTMIWKAIQQLNNKINGEE